MTSDIYDARQSLTTDMVTISGTRGAVSSSHPLATAAGVSILRSGGNAIDAAIAIAATLGVVEPAMSGPGGSGYMIVSSVGSEPAVLDFMGAIPSAAPSEPPGPDELMTGMAGCLVPAAAAGWIAAHRRFGRLSLAAAFADAIELARDGVPLTPKNAAWVARSTERLAGDPSLAHRYVADARPLAAGSLLRQPELARTYATLAADGGEDFYRGATARGIVASCRAGGGFLSRADLEEYQPRWSAPLATRFRASTVLVPPPPCAGWQALATLRLMEGFPTPATDADREHLRLECIKRSVALRRDLIAHATTAEDVVPPSDAEIDVARTTLDLGTVGASDGDRPGRGGVARVATHTTSFVVMDREGATVSCTQSLGQLFGGARTFEDTGVVCNDFAWWTDPAGGSAFRPGGRVDSPLAPLLAQCDDGARIALATPGSNGILQTLPQMLANVIDRGLAPAAALSAPRLVSFGRHPFSDPWGVERPPTLIGAEDRFGAELLADLRRRGHVVEMLGAWSHTVGCGALIKRSADGVLVAAADPRRDGHAAAF